VTVRALRAANIAFVPEVTFISRFAKATPIYLVAPGAAHHHLAGPRPMFIAGDSGPASFAKFAGPKGSLHGGAGSYLADTATTSFAA